MNVPTDEELTAEVVRLELATRAEFSHVLGVAAFLAHGTQMGAQA